MCLDNHFGRKTKSNIYAKINKKYPDTPHPRPILIEKIMIISIKVQKCMAYKRTC